MFATKYPSYFVHLTDLTAVCAAQDADQDDDGKKYIWLTKPHHVFLCNISLNMKSQFAAVGQTVKNKNNYMKKI